MAPGSENGGCLNCYACRQAARGLPGLCFPDGKPAARCLASRPRWTGRVELIPSMLDIPLRRKKPTTWFVNSMSDLFHEALPDQAIDRVFAVMALCPQHTFQVLTKRPERMRAYVSDTSFHGRGLGNDVVTRLADILGVAPVQIRRRWPLPNLWKGVSCEDQKTADERIPLVLQTPAALRFVSLEPMLGPVDLKGWLIDEIYKRAFNVGRLDWVILGGESGPGARPMHPQSVRTVRDQCVEAGVPFFFKQWGESRPWDPGDPKSHSFILRYDGQVGCLADLDRDANPHMAGRRPAIMVRVGKRAAGHLLDGKEWRQMPEVGR